MKVKNRLIKIMLFSVIAVLGLGFAQYDVMAATTSEAGNTATIEIKEDWEPPTLPITKPDPVIKQPVKAATLPKTGEKAKTYLASGGLLMLVGAIALVIINKRRLTR